MIGKTISHYRILEKLGEGGMGVVYKAEDTKLKRIVAIKFLPRHIAASAEERERFKIEAQAAAALNHPNIATIYAIEEVDDEMFIVMEFIEGQELKKKVISDQLSLNSVINIAMQIAEGLKAAHIKGITHRDIKSSNIMITESDHVKIMDFGLAKIGKGVQLTKTGMTLGTAAYMSPEQTWGEPVDHRTDIWSFGVVLYEMLTGRVPFRGEYEQAVIYSILNEEPEPLLSLRPEAPTELERIVSTALAKDSNERYQHVEEMRLALDALTKNFEAGVSAEQPYIPVPFIADEIEVLDEHEPFCVGRGRELAKLDKFLDLTLSEKGEMIFITGEAGSGKTTLIRTFEYLAQKRREDLIVARGKCDAHTGIGDPYLPFRDVLSMLTGEVEAMWAAGAITKEHATRLWNFLPLSIQALVEAGPDLIGRFVPGETLVKRAGAFTSNRASWWTHFKKQVKGKTAATASHLQQSDLFKQFTTVLQTLSRQQPLLIILDDLQWADAGSISLLFHLGRRIERDRILIVGTYRSTEVALGRSGERHPLASVINECQGIFGDFKIELDQAAGRHFINAFIDTEPNRVSASFRDTLFQQTEGHALFTVELLHGMQEQGVLVRDQEGMWIEGSALNWNTLPARVDAVVGERIERLPENLKKLLVTASVEGEEFVAEVVARLHGTNELEMIRLLSADLEKHHNLVSAQGIQRMNGQRLSLYRFRHVLFQKYLYNSLDEIERAYLHEEAGAALENLYGERADEIAVQLARHFREAGIAEKAVDYLIKAAKQARQVYANAEALAHYQQALALIKQASWPKTKPEQRQELTAQILEGLGDIQTTTGQHEEARASFQEALKQGPQHNVIWQSRLYRKVGKTFEVQRRFDEALQTYKLAESVLGPEQEQHPGDWWHEWIEAQAERIWMHYWQAQLSEMNELAGKVRPAVEQYGNPAQRARFFNGLTLMGYRRSRYVISDEIIAHSRAAFSASRESKNLISLGMSCFLLGFSLLWRGDLDEAEERMQESLKLAERTGDVVLQSRCLTYLTVLYRKRGEIEKVRQNIPRCETVASAGQMIEYLATAKANTAWVAWREGNLPEVITNGQAALETWQQLPAGHASTAFRWTAFWPLIGVSITQDQISEAIDYARGLLDSSQMMRVPEALTAVLEKAIYTWQGGDAKETCTNLNQALELAQKMGYL
jgi:tRNA A-37 threonylcarbamoyl transferase component Bud32/tetratricopeptide (TPR) repeat protein/energy-coupling factor transporter ATP-binding protein EcfA2